jgi:hypothetical protein
MFAGRVPDIMKLETILQQTRHNNSEHFLINGARGIGKSSLFLYVRSIADGSIKPLKDHGGPFNYLTVEVDLHDDNTYASIVRNVGRQLKRSLERANKLQAYANLTWSFLKRLEVGGVRYHAEEQRAAEDADELMEELVDHIQQVAKQVVYDGVLILVDEADKPPPEAHLGRLTKLFVERLSRGSCDNVCLGLAGLPTLVDHLNKSHGSAVRIFEPMQLLPLESDDSMSAVRLGIEHANRDAPGSIAITDEALERIADWSDGYPAVIQEFAYCAFNSDTDNVIDGNDVENGAYGKSGAYERLGDKYFKEIFFGQVKSDGYRQMLRFMSQSGTHWVTKDSIRQGTGLSESVLTNGISALSSREIILLRPGVKGEYRLPSRALATWIKEFGDQTVRAR